MCEREREKPQEQEPSRSDTTQIQVLWFSPRAVKRNCKNSSTFDFCQTKTEPHFWTPLVIGCLSHIQLLIRIQNYFPTQKGMYIYSYVECDILNEFSNFSLGKIQFWNFSSSLRTNIYKELSQYQDPSFVFFKGEVKY